MSNIKINSSGFGKSFQKARIHEEFSQKDVALAIGLKTSAISRYERDESTPSIYIAYAMCKSIGYSLDEVYQEKTRNRPVLKEVLSIIDNLDHKKLKALKTILKNTSKSHTKQNPLLKEAISSLVSMNESDLKAFIDILK